MEHSERVREYREKYAKTGNEETLDALSFNCFQVINYLIDLAEEAARKKYPKFFPSTYRETFDGLLQKGVLSESDLEPIYLLVSARNRIAHRYHTVERKDILETADAILKLETVVKKIAAVT